MTAGAPPGQAPLRFLPIEDRRNVRFLGNLVARKAVQRQSYAAHDTLDVLVPLEFQPRLDNVLDRQAGLGPEDLPDLCGGLRVHSRHRVAGGKPYVVQHAALGNADQFLGRLPVFTDRIEQDRAIVVIPLRVDGVQADGPLHPLQRFAWRARASSAGNPSAPTCRRRRG